MSTFQSVKIKSVCEKVASGGTPSRKRVDYFTDTGGHLWVKSKELLEKGITDTEEKITEEGLQNSSAKFYPANTVLVAMYGVNAGQLGWLKKPATVNQAICALVVDPEKADWRFVYYSLLESRQNLISQARGGAQPNLNKEMVENFEIPMASDLPTQTRIASVLSAYDDLIENNEKRIKTLEEMAQLLYNEWFVKLKFPGHEKVKMVDSGTEYDMVPKGWGVKKLGDLLKLEYGDALTETNRRDGDIPVFGSGGQFAFHNAFLAKGPGIIIGRAGIPGAVHWSQSDFFCVDSTFYVVSDLSKYFLYYLLKRINLKRFAAGAAVPGLNRTMAYSIKIILPKINLIALYTEKVKASFAEAYKLKEQNRGLSQVRDLLIPQLVTGKRELK